MGEQLNTILQLLMFTGLVGVLLVVFFLLDRVNDLHKATNFGKGQIKKDQTFGGLTGKNLWDAMIGIPSPGWSQKKLAELRPRYELVLQKHIELLFEDGKFDGKEGFSAPVRSDRMVTTLRGEVESWIPHEFASGIYKAGYQLEATPAMEEEVIREQVDMIGEAIYSAAGLPPQPLSKLLMPPPRPERKQDDENEPNEDTEAALAEGENADAEQPVEGEPQEGELPALPAPDAPDYLEPQFDENGQPITVGAAEADDQIAAEASAETSDTADAGTASGEPVEADSQTQDPVKPAPAPVG